MRAMYFLQLRRSGGVGDKMNRNWRNKNKNNKIFNHKIIILIGTDKMVFV